MKTFACPHLRLCQLMLFVVPLSFNFQGYRHSRRCHTGDTLVTHRAATETKLPLVLNKMDCDVIYIFLKIIELLKYLAEIFFHFHPATSPPTPGGCDTCCSGSPVAVLVGNVFYMLEYRDIFLMLLKDFDETRQSR